MSFPDARTVDPVPRREDTTSRKGLHHGFAQPGHCREPDVPHIRRAVIGRIAVRSVATTASLLATVKTHLIHVCEKTGCRRQADLVRPAKSLTFPV